eukprot:11836673-Alexandrium_andersonii.AAC.1
MQKTTFPQGRLHPHGLEGLVEEPRGLARRMSVCATAEGAEHEHSALRLDCGLDDDLGLRLHE